MSQSRNSPTAANHIERNLLLCCARASVVAGGTDRIRGLAREGLAWAYVIQEAERHGILPIVYRLLVSTCPDMVPRAVLDRLEESCDRNARRNFVFTGELLRCLDLLGAHGMPAVPFKGPVLAASVYGDISLRQFIDLDLLVHEKDVLRARNLLVSEGYRPEFRLNRAQDAAYLGAQSALKLSCDDGAVTVELHWRVTESYFSFPLDAEQLWQRLVPVSLMGKEVRTVSPEDLLLILCAHGTKHLWERLGWVCDVAKLVCTHEAMNWQWVVEQARALGSERMLFLGLFLAHNLMGAPLPQKVLERVQADAAVALLAGEVHRRLMSGAHAQPGDLERCLFHLKARERLQHKVRYCLLLAVTTTPGDWTAVRLPPSLFPLYYLFRPIRLLLAYGPGLLRRSL